MTSLEAIVLGIVQGATEFLPVSSSGHLVLTQQLLGWQEPNLVFDVWLHFSTLLAVVIFFWADIWSLWRDKWKFVSLILASVPAAAVGIFFEDAISGLFASTQAVAVALLVTGTLNLLNNYFLKNKQKENLDDSSKVSQKKRLGQSFVVGIFQAFAIIPGISRSGSTVFAGIFQGWDRFEAFRFSFLLSIPAILGAAMIQLLKLNQQGSLGEINAVFGLAALAAFLTGLASLNIFKFLIKKANLDWFGYYCLVLGLGYLMLI